jgi:uncharacterized membrane protein YqgA involved in biofilm formation
MPDVTLNFVAIIIAAVLGMLVGAIWFSSLLFGRQWLKAVGKTVDQTANPAPTYALTSAATLITAYVLAHLLDYAQAGNISKGLQAAFWAWLGFVAPVIGINALFEGKPRNLYLITVGHHLAVLLVMAAVLVLWQ